MTIAIERIIIKERIRKEITKISELAEDIRENGLLNPITVMMLDGGKYQLLAGLRRLKAVQSLGHTEIAVNVVFPADAEAALRIEISENEQREDFTYSEKMDFARLLEDIERAKAKERMMAGKSVSGPTDARPGGSETRDLVGARIGMSGRQYDRAKYIAENAPDEVIEQLDKGERNIYKTYNELRAKEKAAAHLTADDSAPHTENPSKQNDELFTLKSETVSEEEQMKYLSKHDKEAARKLKEFNALPPEGKIKALEQQVFDMRVRAVAAESDLSEMKRRYDISVDHKDSIIESLKRQNTELIAALEEAEARIAELERDKEADYAGVA